MENQYDILPVKGKNISNLLQNSQQHNLTTKSTETKYNPTMSGCENFKIYIFIIS